MRTHPSHCQTQDLHTGLAPGEEAAGAAPVAVAGRVMAKRVMGKLAFLSIRDDQGQIQVRCCGVLRILWAGFGAA